MDKIEALRIAADAVMDSEYNNNIKLEVLEILFEEKRNLEWLSNQKSQAVEE